MSQPRIQRYQGTLALDQAGRLMRSDAVQQLLPLLTAQIGRAQRFFLTVRNQDTGDQHMHPHPVTSLAKWQLHFVDTPLFRSAKGVDLLRDPYFPVLHPPAVGRAWTLEPFTKGGVRFLAIVTAAPPDSIPRPGPHLDTIQFYLCSPTMPTNHAAMMHIAQNKPNAQAKRLAIVTHLAAIAMARAHGLQEQPWLMLGHSDEAGPSGDGGKDSPRANTAHHDAAHDTASDLTLVYGEEVFHANAVGRACLMGTAVSKTPEASAGSVVLPLLLRHCSFLLPLLTSASPHGASASCDVTGHDLHYSIVQTHRYGYALQIQHLAGWRLLAAINLWVNNMDALASLFEVDASNRSSSATDTTTIAALLPATVALHTPTSFVAATHFYDIVQGAYQTNLQEFGHTVTAAWGNDTPVAFTESAHRGGAPIALTKFRPKLHEKLAMPPPVWRCFAAHDGLRRLLRLAQDRLLAANNAQAALQGRRVLELWLASFLRTAPDTDAPALASMEVFGVLFQACHGLARVVVDLHLARTASRRQNAPYHPKALASTLKRFVRQDQPPVLEAPELLTIARNLHTVPPIEWAGQALVPLFGEGDDLLAFAAALITRPSTYAALLTPFLQTTLHKDLDKALSMLANARFTKAEIQRAALSARWCVNATTPPSKKHTPESGDSAATREFTSPKARRHLTLGLAYLFFAHDPETQLANWG